MALTLCDVLKCNIFHILSVPFLLFLLHLSFQHLLDYNDRPDLSLEDREMLIEDLVLFLLSLTCIYSMYRFNLAVVGKRKT